VPTPVSKRRVNAGSWHDDGGGVHRIVRPGFERETVIVYRVVSEGDPGAEVFKGGGS